MKDPSKKTLWIESGINSQRQEIVQEWRRRVLRDAAISQVNQLEEPVLSDHIPDFIDVIADSIGRYGTDDLEKSGERMVKGHASTQLVKLRTLVSHSLPQALGELSHLRGVIDDLCLSKFPGSDEAQILHAAMDQAMAVVGDEISKCYLNKIDEKKIVEHLTAQAAMVVTWERNIHTGRILWAGRAKDIYGEEPPAHHEAYVSIVHPDDRQYFATMNNYAIETRGKCEIEFRIVWPDESVRWLSSRGQVLSNVGGVAVRFLGICMDITEHKMVEAERDRFFELSADMLCIASFDGYFGRVNPAWERTLKYSSEELTSQPWITFVHPDDQEASITEENRLVAGFSVTCFENRYRRRDGTYRWFLWSARADPTEKIMYCVVRDITEDKEAQLRLKRSEENFRQLAEAMPQIVFSAAAEGYIDYFNEGWYHYTGLDDDKSLGMKWLSAVHPDDRGGVQNGWEEALLKCKPFSIELRIKGRQGSYRWHLCRKTPVFNDNQDVVRWLGTSTDIDDQKRWQVELCSAKDQADTANRAKSAFLTAMSHELRTPLSAILGFAELLDEPDLSEDERHSFVATIRRNGRHLSQLIDDILDLSKVESGKLAIEKMECSIPEMISDIRSMINPQIRKKGILFSVRSKGAIPELITTDPLRLKQILINIVGNAIKFTDAGGVEMVVETVQKEGNVATIRFVVTDTGCGIGLELSRSLFQIFTQGDALTTRTYGGTGLGLVLSRRLAEALGGTVELTSSIAGKGSTFSIVIVAENPVGQVTIKNVDNVLASVSHTPNGQFLRGIKVLVAEDSLDSRFMLARMIGGAGAEVEVVDNGKEAIEMALRGGYDVVLMDVQMPGLDGIEVTIKLREQGYEKPIVALSAYTTNEIRDRCLLGGCNDYWTKPIAKNDLIERIIKTIRP